jgi:hypothetical protein
MLPIGNKFVKWGYCRGPASVLSLDVRDETNSTSRLDGAMFDLMVICDDH